MPFFKKLGALLLSAVMMLSVVGCGAAGKSSDAKVKVVCTIFPEYEWTLEIMGDLAKDAEITYLLDNGIDLHNYQPTAEDIMKIGSCDLFIYVGGESDDWVEDALKEATNKKMKVINMLDVIGSSAKEEEVKEGMQAEEEEHEEEEEGPEYDEHVWLSLRNAKTLCTKISDELCAIDKDNAKAYKANLADYTEKLDALDSDFKELFDNASEKTLIFGDRFPFRYFTDDYGLDYYAAFVGCSAETEASFETITFLAGKLDELGADTIYTIENSDSRIAESVIDSTKSKDQKIAVLESVQSVSKEQMDEGVTYLSLMQKNYDTLKADLG